MIDANMAMWAFGLAVAGIGGLLSTLFFLMHYRLQRIEDGAREDRREFLETARRIHERIESFDRDVDAFIKHVGENYMTKTDCARAQQYREAV